MVRHSLTGTATGFSLPFLVAGETRLPTLAVPNLGLTTVLLQFGKPRRTNRCIHLKCGHGSRALDGQGICRISESLLDGYIGITASISLSVSRKLSIPVVYKVTTSRIAMTSAELLDCNQ